MHDLAVTAIGADRPGIVAAVAEVLAARGGNVEDSAMTILGGHFAIMLLVASDDEPQTLQAALDEAAAGLGLVITVNRVGAGHEAQAPTHVLSVYGSDRPGILAGVSRVLADHGANITDLQTRLLPGEPPVYAMVIELSLPGALTEEDLEAALQPVCDELGVDRTLRPLEAETY